MWLDVPPLWLENPGTIPAGLFVLRFAEKPPLHQEPQGLHGVIVTLFSGFTVEPPSKSFYIKKGIYPLNGIDAPACRKSPAKAGLFRMYKI